MRTLKGLTLLLLAAVGYGAPSPATAEPLLPVLDSKDAWACLGPAEQGSDSPLPVWARMLARPIPRTTEAMLEFDYIHRTQSPLHPKLRATLRYVIAETNRCDYTRQTALLDLQQAGATPQQLGWLQESPPLYEHLSAEEQRAVELVRMLTTKASEVTDEQFAEIVQAFGEEQTTAIVLLTAGANFQDRLLLALCIPAEPAGPLPPAEIFFKRDVPAETLPPAPERKQLRLNEPLPSLGTTTAPAVDWDLLSWDDLQQSMEKQKQRPGRVTVPTNEEYLEKIGSLDPARYAVRNRPTGVIWTRVCSGYQPLLAAAWSQCTSSFRDDAKPDRVFQECLFWVVTRSIDCFY